MSTPSIRIRVPRTLYLDFKFETDSVAGLVCCAHWFRSCAKDEKLALAAATVLEKRGYHPHSEECDTYTALDAAEGKNAVVCVPWYPTEGFDLPLTDSDGALYCAVQCMKHWVRVGATTAESLAAAQAELDRRMAERKAA